MKLDWSALERIEMTSWLLPSNDVFPYPVIIHGSQSGPNKDALEAAKEVMSYCEFFTKAASTHLETFINPRIIEDGIITDSFHFFDYSNSFYIHFDVKGDQFAHWKIRFIRNGSIHLNNFRPCQITRQEQ